MLDDEWIDADADADDAAAAAADDDDDDDDDDDCCRQTEHFCLSRDFTRQASAQTMCVSSEWSSLVSFDPVFVKIFRFCNLTDLT